MLGLFLVFKSTCRILHARPSGEVPFAVALGGKPAVVVLVSPPSQADAAFEAWHGHSSHAIFFPNCCLRLLLHAACQGWGTWHGVEVPPLSRELRRPRSRCRRLLLSQTRGHLVWCGRFQPEPRWLPEAAGPPVGWTEGRVGNLKRRDLMESCLLGCQ